MSVDQPATQPLLCIEDTGPTSHARFRAYVTHYSNTSFEDFADFSRTPPNITSKSTCLLISSPYLVRLKRAIDEDIPHQRQESCFSIRDSHAFTQLAERRSPFYESRPRVSARLRHRPPCLSMLAKNKRYTSLCLSAASPSAKRLAVVSIHLDRCLQYRGIILSLLSANERKIDSSKRCWISW